MARIISALILAVTAACASAQESSVLIDNPPDRHVVVPGDTLWGISAKFLKQPWRWPEVWRLNKEDIKNPHRIYPGDIVLLDHSTGNPRLKIAKPLKLQPQIYSDQKAQAIPSIPAKLVEPFISRPLIVEADELNSAPRIVATQEERVYLGGNDLGFVSGINNAEVPNWQIFRPGAPLKDPETGEVIAYEAYYLGDARLTEVGNPSTIKVIRAKEEIGKGDRLVPAAPLDMASYVPHEPDLTIKGRIMSIYGGVNEGGKYSIVSINKGGQAGLEVGHVLALSRKQVSYHYDDDNKRQETDLPEQRYGLAFVFRVFDKVAYALIMQSSKSVVVGDKVHNP